MPEYWDKHGPPKLWATVRCLVPGCQGKRLVEPQQAESLARKLEAGLGMRYLIRRLKCRTCGHRNAEISFHLAHAGQQPWSPHRPAPQPHRGGPGAITDQSASLAHAKLPVVVRGSGSTRKTK